MTTGTSPGTSWGLVAGMGILAGLLAIVGAGWLLDPLRVFDVRDVTWSGVVISALERRLDDGRVVHSERHVASAPVLDDDLLIGGGTVDAPTWMVSVRPHPDEPTCYQSRAMGYDDGRAVVLIHDDGDTRFGFRLAKAAGFTSDDVTDGRYIAVDSGARHVAALSRGPWASAKVSYFCLDREARVTRWDRGY